MAQLDTEICSDDMPVGANGGTIHCQKPNMHLLSEALNQFHRGPKCHSHLLHLDDKAKHTEGQQLADSAVNKSDLLMSVPAIRTFFTDSEAPCTPAVEHARDAQRLRQI